MERGRLILNVFWMDWSIQSLPTRTRRETENTSSSSEQDKPPDHGRARGPEQCLHTVLEFLH